MSSTKRLKAFTNREAQAFSGEQISFSFGRNWQKYLAGFDQSALTQAEGSLVNFTGQSTLQDETFLDFGCGSGLSSLCAYRLGARKVVSVDIDPYSIECVTNLRGQFGDDRKRWDVLNGSALDEGFVASLGRFSYVYSWGVLHHTGSMWKAIENVLGCVEPGGKLHLALYNEHRNSARWLKVKRICNRWPRTVFPLLKVGLAGLTCARLLARLQSPVKYAKKYREDRGMTMWRDIEDWLGGLPYEYCTPHQLEDFVSSRRFSLLRKRIVDTIGCNEFLFRSEPVREDRNLV